MLYLFLLTQIYWYVEKETPTVAVEAGRVQDPDITLAHSFIAVSIGKCLKFYKWSSNHSSK